jgi:hypothetical protein
MTHKIDGLMLIHVVETASLNNARCRKTKKRDLDKMRRQGTEWRLEENEVRKRAIKRYFISNFCADSMYLKCGISFKKKA